MPYAVEDDRDDKVAKMARFCIPGPIRVLIDVTDHVVNNQQLIKKA